MGPSLFYLSVPYRHLALSFLCTGPQKMSILLSNKKHLYFCGPHGAWSFQLLSNITWILKEMVTPQERGLECTISTANTWIMLENFFYEMEELSPSTRGLV